MSDERPKERLRVRGEGDDARVVGRRAGKRGTTEPGAHPWLARSVALAVRGFGSLPLAWTHAFGGVVGWLGGLLPTRERHVTDVNLRLAFPELDDDARRRLTRRSLVETGKTFAELGKVWSLDRDGTDRTIRRVEGEDHVRAAVEAGRGVVLAVPHLACWEILGSYCSARWPMTTLYRAPRMRELETFTRNARGRFGARLVPAGLGATRALLRALRDGQIVAMLPDQDAGEGAGVFVPFFGVEVNTMTLVSGLAARTGAPVILGHAVRLPRGRGFDLRFVPASLAVHDPDPVVSAAALNADIERLVRERPEQYLWSYKRFRFLPPGRPNPYAKAQRG